MRKTFILLGILFLFSSCFSNNQEKKGDIAIEEQNVIEEVGLIEEVEPFDKEADKKKFYATLMPKDFSESGTFQGYLDWFSMLKQDKSYFEKEDKKLEIDFFYVWSDFLFNTSHSNEDLTPFKDCMNGENNLSEIRDTFLRKLCEGKEGYDEKEDEYFDLLKSKFLDYKNLFTQGKDFPVDNFEEYLVKKVYYDKQYSSDQLLKEYFYYTKAIELQKCEYLEDEILTKLCNVSTKALIEKIKE